MKLTRLSAALTLLAFCSLAARAADPLAAPGDKLFADYFRHQTQLVAAQSLADIQSADDWNKRKADLRRELAEMLGLHPMPERTDLKPTITGRIEHSDFIIEKLHFQSRPGLYVTANLYLPRNTDNKPVPAILYVCGHSPVKKDNVSYGNKTAYQHHAIWFARNGYVCLVPDTLQMGEIEGIHHGLYREKLWNWISRGYTPAGVEAWNSIRALDYLQSRPEVDKEKLGMTGRSGGGAYSWWTAALDERVKAAVPVAGITDMHNHIVDGVIEGHCDCMYMTNTYRWDFAPVAALVAPRALLLSNSDKDTIFPLDGVERLHAQVARIYKLNNADKNLGLLITEGPHKDTQDLQVPAFRWFNRFLKNNEGTIEVAATVKLYQPEELRVFPPGQDPADQINTKVHDSFIPIAPAPAIPTSKQQWDQQRDQLLTALRQQTFRAWPDSSATDKSSPAAVREVLTASKDNHRVRVYEFISEAHVPLKLYLIDSPQSQPKYVSLTVLDSTTWPQFAGTFRGPFPQAFPEDTSPPPRGFAIDGNAVNAYVAPRGVGPTRYLPDNIANPQADIRDAKLLKKDTQLRRRFWLLGASLEGQQTYDIRRAVQSLRAIEVTKSMPIHLRSQKEMAALTLYASLFEPNVERLDLHNLPASHVKDGPQLLNVLKVLDLPTTAALVASRTKLTLHQPDAPAWDYARAVTKAINVVDHFNVRAE